MGCIENDGVEERIGEIRRRDRRFGRNAYYFVLDALDHTIVHLGRDAAAGDERHIDGHELLEGIRELGADQFGPMASLVFKRWGLRNTEDFGEIVFSLIESGLLSRRAEDSRLDFSNGYEFDSAFEEMFRRQLTAISAADS